MNQELYEQLAKAEAFLTQLWQCQDEKNRQTKEKDELSDLLSRKGEKIVADGDNSYSGNAKGLGILLLVIGGVVSFPFLLLLAIGGFAEFFKEGGYTYIYILLGCFFTIIGGVLFIVTSGIVKKQRSKQNSIQAQAEFDKKVSEAERRMPELEAAQALLIVKMEALVQRESGSLDFLPKAYRNLHAIWLMQEYVENLRAFTLPEAIRLYEEHEERKMEREIRKEAERERERQHAQMMDAMAEIQSNQEQAHRDAEMMRDLKLMEMSRNNH